MIFWIPPRKILYTPVPNRHQRVLLLKSADTLTTPPKRLYLYDYGSRRLLAHDELCLDGVESEQIGHMCIIGQARQVWDSGGPK